MSDPDDDNTTERRMPTVVAYDRVRVEQEQTSTKRPSSTTERNVYDGCVPGDQVAYEAGLLKARSIVQERLNEALSDPEEDALAFALQKVADDIYAEFDKSQTWRLSSQGIDVTVHRPEGKPLRTDDSPKSSTFDVLAASRGENPWIEP